LYLQLLVFQLSRSSIIITNVLADFLLDSFTEFGSSFVRTLQQHVPAIEMSPFAINVVGSHGFSSFEITASKHQSHVWRWSLAASNILAKSRRRFGPGRVRDWLSVQFARSA
jgi:hypothetical protein